MSGRRLYTAAISSSSAALPANLDQMSGSVMRQLQLQPVLPGKLMRAVLSRPMMSYRSKGPWA